MTVPSPQTNTYLRVTIQNTSTHNLALDALKYLTFVPNLNTTNNLPFYTDFSGDLAIGFLSSPTPITTFAARVMVQGATSDASTTALSVTNSSGTPVLTAGDAGVVGIGTQTLSSSQCGATTAACSLIVNGAIGTKEIVVTNAITADYVFKPTYRLASLEEVAKFIKAEHHLPGIPSETQARRDGINVGQMQAQLLAKVEELTLHLIKSEAENQKLNRRLSRLEASLSAKSR